MNLRLDDFVRREHMLGTRGSIRGSVHFITEYSIAYASGNIVVIYDIYGRKQDFIIGTNSMEDINAIALSPCRGLLLIGKVLYLVPGIIHTKKMIQIIFKI